METGQAVTAVSEIGRVIGQINDFQASIAGAVEEQTATTADMSRAVEAAARGAGEITSVIASVAGAAGDTTRSVADQQVATEDLARMGARLTSLVGPVPGGVGLAYPAGVSDVVYPPAITLTRAVFAGLGLRFTIEGAHHLPRSGGAVIASNHVGYLDFTFVGYAARPSGRLVRFMAKEAVFRHPVSAR
jgi:hypothetical protein